MATQSLPNSHSFENQTTAICSKCGIEKCFSLMAKDSRKASGIAARCKACVVANSKRWAQTHRDMLADRARERYASDEKVRRQTAARVRKWKDENRAHWNETKKAQDLRRRARAKGMTVAEYLAPKPPVKPKRLRIDGISIKKHRKTIRFCPVLTHNPKLKYRVFKQESLIRSKEYYWKNLSKARRRVRKWKSKNPGLVSQQRYRRRTALENAENTLTSEQWAAIVTAYRGRCAYCGRRKKLTMDHVQAVVRDGHHVPENIVPACQSCNSSKGASGPKVEYQPHLIR